LGASHCKSDNQQICFLGFLSLLGLLGLACSWFPWFPWFPCFLSFFIYFFISFFFFLFFLSTSFHIYSCRRHKIEDGAILQGKAALLPSGFKCSLSRKWQNQTSFHMNSHDLYNFSKEYHWCQVSPNSRIFKCHCFWRRILPLRCCFIFLVLPNMMIRKLHWSITISPIKMQLFWGYTWLY
jgi:hypothetical protein